MEFLNDSGDHTHGEVNEEQLAKKLGEFEVLLLARYIPSRLEACDKPHQAQSDRNEKEMVDRGDTELPSRKIQYVHMDNPSTDISAGCRNVAPISGTKVLLVASQTTPDVRGVTEAPLAKILVPLITLWIVWGSTYVGLGMMVKTMPPLLGAGTRFLAAAAILAVVVLILRGPRVFNVTWAQFRGAMFMGASLLGIGIGILSLAQRYVPSGIAALIVSVMPLWIIFFRLRAGDRPARLTVIGVGVGLFGLGLMLLPGGTQPQGGAGTTQVTLWSIAIAIGSFCWAFFSWRSTRYQQPNDLLVTTVIELFSAGFMLSALGLITGDRWESAKYSTESWIGWGALVLASAIVYSAYVWLLGNAPMSLVSTYAYVNPVVAVLLGFIVLSEPLTSDVILGLTIVVGGVILVVSGERRPKLVPQELG